MLKESTVFVILSDPVEEKKKVTLTASRSFRIMCVTEC